MKYNSDEKQGLLDDLLNVGSDKPMGYLPLSTLRDVCDNDSLQGVLCILVLKGLTVVSVPEGECTVAEGALWVWDHKALGRLLWANQGMLYREKWPVDADAFARRVMVDHAERFTPLFTLIADAFGDKKNFGRLP